MRVLSDVEVEQLATPRVVTTSMRRAVLAAWRGHLVAPPRAKVELGDKPLMFSCGRVPGDWFGYRSYVAPGAGKNDQLVLVQDDTTGAVRGLAVGKALGPRRAGGIGVGFYRLASSPAWSPSRQAAGRQPDSRRQERAIRADDTPVLSGHSGHVNAVTDAARRVAGTGPDIRLSAELRCHAHGQWCPRAFDAFD